MSEPSPSVAPDGSDSSPTRAHPPTRWAEKALYDDRDSFLDPGEVESIALGDDGDWASGADDGESTEFDDDQNSASDAESTASLTPTIGAYRTLYGRTYCRNVVADEQSWTPNDEAHKEASDLTHHMLTRVLGGALCRAPLEGTIRKTLDVGTGMGIWAIDFADQFPNTTVIGTDISPHQPAWVPPNLRFELDDATREWLYPENTFDYVHMRGLAGCIPDWHHLLRQAYRSCQPGGYVESSEMSCCYRSDDGTLADGIPMEQWGRLFVEAGKRSGRPFGVVEDGIVQDAFRDAGFVDVVEWEFKLPLGTWPKDPELRELGAWALAARERDIEGWILYLWTQVMGWTREETMAYISHLRRQYRDPSVHGYCRVRVVYGRKPEVDAPRPAPITTTSSPSWRGCCTRVWRASCARVSRACCSCCCQ